MLMNDPTVSIKRVEAALSDLRAGKMVVLLDAETREHEGDLVLAAEKVTPEAVNFMSKYARGLMCLPMTAEMIQRLELPFMPKRHASETQAAFTVSIDAVNCTGSGISAEDRAHTIRVAIDPSSTPADIAYPGHVFPLRAEPKGVLARPGHTEGSVDLMKLAGLQPAAVISEILNEDGTMARLQHLRMFAEMHGLRMVAVEDIIQYRLSGSERRVD